jgi:hypothetical protein
LQGFVNFGLNVRKSREQTKKVGINSLFVRRNKMARDGGWIVTGHWADYCALGLTPAQSKVNSFIFFKESLVAPPKTDIRRALFTSFSTWAFEYLPTKQLLK